MNKLILGCAILCALLAVAPTSSNAEDNKNLRNSYDRAKRDVTCGTPTTLSEAQAQEIVNSHNQFRSQETATNMLSMVWSAELAALAQALANTCKGEHGMQDDCSGNRMGQNMFLSGRPDGFPTFNINNAVASWMNEKKDYNFATGTCNPAPGITCGHYTQVVWARSSEVGCGVAQCRNVVTPSSTYAYANIFVCNYRNPGNVQGQAVFLPGSPCSNCDSDSTGSGYKCNNKLCSKCTPSTDSTCQCGTALACQNGGVWSTSTCACTCAKGFYGDKCQFPCNCDDLNPSLCRANTNLCTQPLYADFMKKTCKKTCNFPCALPAICSA